MKIRLIAADVDGTLVDSEKRISPATEAAVKKARELGVIFTLSTGRTVQGLGKYLYLVKPGTPIVTYNGAEVLIPDTGEVLYRQGLEASAAEEIIRSGMSLGASVIVWSRGVLYLSGKNERTEKYRRIYNAEGRPITDPAALAAEGVTKAMWLDEPGIIERSQKEFCLGGVCCVISEPGYLEFIDARVSKAEGLKKAAEYLNVRREEVMALGDSYNDTDMLRWAGLGVAMANAEEEVKAAADHITASNEEDGVARAIETFVLK